MINLQAVVIDEPLQSSNRTVNQFFRFFEESDFVFQKDGARKYQELEIKRVIQAERESLNSSDPVEVEKACKKEFYELTGLMEEGKDFELFCFLTMKKVQNAKDMAKNMRQMTKQSSVFLGFGLKKFTLFREKCRNFVSVILTAKGKPPTEREYAKMLTAPSKMLFGLEKNVSGSMIRREIVIIIIAVLNGHQVSEKDMEMVMECLAAMGQTGVPMIRIFYLRMKGSMGTNSLTNNFNNFGYEAATGIELEKRPVLVGGTDALNSALSLIAQYVVQKGGKFLKEHLEQLGDLPESLINVAKYIGQAYNFTGNMCPMESTSLTEEEEKRIIEGEEAVERAKICLEELVDVNTNPPDVGDDDEEISDEMFDSVENLFSSPTSKTPHSIINQLPSTPDNTKEPSTPRTEVVLRKKRKLNTSTNFTDREQEDVSEQEGKSYEIDKVLFVSEVVGILVCWKDYKEDMDSLEKITACSCHQLVFENIGCSFGLYDLIMLNRNQQLWNPVLRRMKTLFGNEFDPTTCIREYKAMIGTFIVNEKNSF